MQKLVQHSSIGVAFVLCKARIEVFPGRVAADRMQKGLGFRLGFRVKGFRLGMILCYQGFGLTVVGSEGVAY